MRAVVQSLMYFRNNAAAVRGCHECREVVFFAAELAVYLHRRVLFVHDYQRVRLALRQFGNCGIAAFAEVIVSAFLEISEIAFVRYQLGKLHVGHIFLEDSGVVGHGSREEKCFAVHVFGYVADSFQAGAQQLGRYKVYLVKYQYRVAQIVQLSQRRAFVVAERVEKLHACRYDEWSVPVFGGLYQQALGFFLVRLVRAALWFV